MDEVNTDPLEPLRRQWEIEKSPRLSLQLAEEYGRRQDYLSAITVLRTGLTRHPRHVASHVLLGRYLVELEQWPEAQETLEQVATADPTHLIANKLLVKTYLATGDRAEARNRLDLYTLLNGSDPDIEELERGLSTELAEAPDEPREEPVDEPLAKPLEEPVGEPVEELVEESAVPAEPVAEELPQAEPAPVFAAPTPTPKSPAAATVVSNEPFGDLPGLDRREKAARTAPAADIFDLARPAVAVAPAVEQEEPEPEEAELSPPADEPATEPEVTTEPEAALEIPSEVEETVPATVSLGRLYLQQGHTADAEATFAAVLGREPDNAAARVGLAAAGGAGDWAISALDLVSPEALSSTDPAQRKRAVLTGYLERLRTGDSTAG